ncbi:potassium channel family protein [Arthrobacter mangrovi]|uniref:Potassium channel domain-containing protein n=1 Tax=Arthrobacter mangrovi TaxID=2966350 RepID=A0ABQ5N034_9MICC|nr:potassium channel family protein [Arthrobacter mangrovi]GLB69577.1 hypothetical protein AHIS1636_40230 [Arthrobacter mangrovi]
MGVALTAAGVMVVVVGLTDMFHTLLHPTGKGRLSRLVLVGTWKLSRASGHRFGSAVGPAAMTAAVLLWVLLQGVGWALIYYPHVPDGFSYSPGIDPGAYSDFAQALYISFVALATLGFGDVVATDPWIRLVSPLEALAGFALLTAALTWFSQVYAPLSRRRALALELKGMAGTGYAERLHELDQAAVSRALDSLTADVAKVLLDFTQHPEGYYFQEEDPDLSLARQLSYALALRDAAAASPSATVRFSGLRLADALDHLGKKLRRDFLSTGDGLEEAVDGYAADHGHSPGNHGPNR